MKVEIVKELSDWKGDAVLVRRGREHFVVFSSIEVPMSGFETLAFESDSSGEVYSYLEVAGGRGRSRSDTIAELEAQEPV